MRLRALRLLVVVRIAIVCTLFSSALSLSVNAAGDESAQWAQQFVAPLAGETTLNFPKQSALDAQGRIYTVDTWNHRVVVFAADGSLQWTLGQPGQIYDPDTTFLDPPPCDTICDGHPELHLGYFWRPKGIDVSDDGKTIVVADSDNHRIQVFTEDPLASGASAVQAVGGPKFKAFAFGSYESWIDQLPPVGKFDRPGGVSFGANGRIAVIDQNNLRVQVFDPTTSSSGQTVQATDGRLYRVFQFGDSVIEDGVNHPFPLTYADDIEIDRSMIGGSPSPTNGRIIVSNTDAQRIEVLSATGVPIMSLGGPEDVIFPIYPQGVAVGDDGRIYIADTGNFQIEVLRPNIAGGYDLEDRFGSYQAQTDPPPPGVTFVAPTSVASRGTRLAVTDSDIPGRVHMLVRAAITLEASTFSATPSAVTIENVGHDTVHVTVKVKNSGTLPLANVTLANVAAGASHPGVLSGLTAPVATLAPGAEASFSFDYQVTGVNTSTSTLAFTLSASGEAAGVVVTDTETFEAAEVAGPSGPAITISQVQTAPTVGIGQQIIITGRLYNTGGKSLTGMSVSITPSDSSKVTLASGFANPTAPASLDPGTPSSPAFVPFTVTFLAAQLGNVSFTIDGTATYQDLSTSPAPPAQTISAPAVVTNVSILDDTTPPVLTLFATGNPDPLSTEGKWYNLATGPPTIHAVAADDKSLARIHWHIETEGTPATDLNGDCTQAGLVPGNPDPSVAPTCTAVPSSGGPVTQLTWTRTFGDIQRKITIQVTAEDATHNVTTATAVLWVDRELPFIDNDRPVINADNTQATVPFTAGDVGRSQVRSITSSLGPTSLNVPAAQTGVLIHGDLFLQGEGADVYADVTVTDHANNSAKFAVPVHLPGVPVLRLDRTPPETFNRIDPAALGRRCTTTIAGQPVNYFCTNKVYGTDNLPGLTTAAFAPISVLPVKWGGDDDNDHDWDGNAEYHVYSFTDAFTPASGPAPVQNPNLVRIVEKVRQSGHEVRVRVLAFQYRQGSVLKPLVVPEMAVKKYEWSTSADGSLKSLNQKFEIGKGRDRVQVLASFDTRSGQTTIKHLGRDSSRVVANGLILLRMTTAAGELKVEYDVNAPAAVGDLAPPVLNLPSSMVVEATSAAGAPVNFTATAFDVYDGAIVPVTCTSPFAATFPIGTTTVGCSASDAAGNVAQASFTITVRTKGGKKK